MDVMSTPKRKLAAIIFTDISGFTELSAKNEPAALDLLNKQREILGPIVARHHGEWLKEIGDGLLLTFETTLDAVNCSIEIQKISQSVPDLKLRIGIHQGEVVFQGDDVVGDDVNIASRIESYSAIGGIAISGRVNASLERNPEFDTTFLGSPTLKGVSQDVKVYCISSHDLPKSNKIIKDKETRKSTINWNIYSITGGVLAIIGFLFWINLSFLTSGIASDNSIPSVVILPFENKGDARDEYYSYGISADLISDITSVGQLRVASLNSVEEMIESGIKGGNIAKSLSSRYVVSGSLWKIDSIFQLSIELYDTEEKMLIISERWETNWSDLPSVKLDLSEKIINGLGVNIINELDNEYVVNSDAYELYLKAKHTFNDRKTVKDNQIARDLLNKALELDSNFVDAKYLLANTYYDSDYDIALEQYSLALNIAIRMDDLKAKMDIKRSMGQIYNSRWEVEKSLKLFRESYRIAKEIGNESSVATAINGLGSFFWERREGDSARYYFKKAYDINKDLGDNKKLSSITNNIGLVHWVFDKDPDKATLDFEESISLVGDANPALIRAQLSNLGIIYHNKGEYEKSKNYYDRVLDYATAVNNRKTIGFIQYWIGLHYHRLHEYETAVEYYLSSYEINDDLGIERWKASSLGGLIICSQFLKNEDLTKKYFDKVQDINTELVNDLYMSIGFEFFKSDNYKLAIDSFIKQLAIEKEKNNKNGIINTLTNIGLSYFYLGAYGDALAYFDKSIAHDGIESLWAPVETLVFKHVSQKMLGLPVNDDYLKSLIKGLEKDSPLWFRNEPAYINWALFEYSGDKKYIEAAYDKIMKVVSKMNQEYSNLFLSYSIQQRILDSFNKFNNI